MFTKPPVVVDDGPRRPMMAGIKYETARGNTDFREAYNDCSTVSSLGEEDSRVNLLQDQVIRRQSIETSAFDSGVDGTETSTIDSGFDSTDTPPIELTWSSKLLPVVDQQKVQRGHSLDTVPKPGRRSISPSRRLGKEAGRPRNGGRSMSPNKIRRALMRDASMDAAPRPVHRSVSPSRKLGQHRRKEANHPRNGGRSMSPNKIRRALMRDASMDAAPRPVHRSVSPSRKLGQHRRKEANHPRNGGRSMSPTKIRRALMRDASMDAAPRPVRRSVSPSKKLGMLQANPSYSGSRVPETHIRRSIQSSPTRGRCDNIRPTFKINTNDEIPKPVRRSLSPSAKLRGASLHKKRERRLDPKTQMKSQSYHLNPSFHSERSNSADTAPCTVERRPSVFTLEDLEDRMTDITHPLLRLDPPSFHSERSNSADTIPCTVERRPSAFTLEDLDNRKTDVTHPPLRLNPSSFHSLRSNSADTAPCTVERRPSVFTTQDLNDPEYQTSHVAHRPVVWLSPGADSDDEPYTPLWLKTGKDSDIESATTSEFSFMYGE